MQVIISFLYGWKKLNVINCLLFKYLGVFCLNIKEHFLSPECSSSSPTSPPPENPNINFTAPNTFY